MKKLFVILVMLVAIIANAQWVQTNGPYGEIMSNHASIESALFGVSAHGVYMTSNNGVSWLPVNNGIADKNIRTITSFGTSLFVGTDHGIYKSTNYGTDWF